MVVTYFLGNGFDIGLGLNTRYNDFVKSYVKHRDGEMPFIQYFKEYVSKEIGESIDAWSDAEKRFGELPFSDFADRFGMSVEDVLLELDADFQDELTKYLKVEEQMFFDRGDDMLSYGKMLLKSGIAAWVDVVKNELVEQPKDISLNFISLNYTRTLEALFGVKDVIASTTDMDMQFEIADGEFPPVRISSISHAHGNLGERFRLFGVDNVVQIADKEAREVCGRMGYLIKKEQDADGTIGAREHCVDVLKKSDWIITLGVSFGVTDGFWWETISDAILNHSAKLILSPFSRNAFEARSQNELIRRRRTNEERFFRRLSPAFRAAFVGEIKPSVYVMDYGPHNYLGAGPTFCDPLNLEYIKNATTSKNIK